MSGTGVVNRLVLVPARDAYDMTRWGAAAANYRRAFGEVIFARDPYAIALDEFERVTVVDPDFWPGDVMAYLRQQAPRIKVEVIFAPTPEVLAEILNARAFFASSYQVAPEQVPQPTPNPELTGLWPRGVCLIGLHGRADGELQDADFSVYDTARIEAAKLTSHATEQSVSRLLEINPRMFIMVRAISGFSDLNGQPRRISPEDFAGSTIPDLARLVDGRRVWDIEIHNEPNLTQEGLGGSWNNGREFADWWLKARDVLRQTFPFARFGFPGLSNGFGVPGVRYDGDQFLNEAEAAVREADWIGIHSYWVVGGMTDPNQGFEYLRYRGRYPDKLLYITEFNTATYAKNDQAQQYAQYYAMLRHEAGLGAAFSYVVSTSYLDESHKFAWRGEDGSDVGIAAVIGARNYVG
ncbi:MAG: hypothetical protein HY023_18795 [Chloroflexi bacterium]|nr:hypothetical protein [Chloroflexota bacterium]MBI3761870.1 hypothetical protein [Chloroflexota bacterium]